MGRERQQTTAGTGLGQDLDRWRRRKMARSMFVSHPFSMDRIGATSAGEKETLEGWGVGHNGLCTSRGRVINLPSWLLGKKICIVSGPRCHARLHAAHFFLFFVHGLL